MIFGTDGVRDIGGQGLLSPDSVDRFGTAILLHLQREGLDAPRILIGRDTRESGPEIELQLTRALHRGAAQTLHAGVVPTPALSVLLAAGHADLGLMISASHNPPEFNGIKVLNRSGEKLTKESEGLISADHAIAEPLEGDFPEVVDGVKKEKGIVIFVRSFSGCNYAKEILRYFMIRDSKRKYQI